MKKHRAYASRPAVSRRAPSAALPSAPLVRRLPPPTPGRWPRLKAACLSSKLQKGAERSQETGKDRTVRASMWVRWQEDAQAERSRRPVFTQGSCCNPLRDARAMPALSPAPLHCTDAAHTRASNHDQLVMRQRAHGARDPSPPPPERHVLGREPTIVAEAKRIRHPRKWADASGTHLPAVRQGTLHPQRGQPVRVSPPFPAAESARPRAGQTPPSWLGTASGLSPRCIPATAVLT